MSSSTEQQLLASEAIGDFGNALLNLNDRMFYLALEKDYKDGNASLQDRLRPLIVEFQQSSSDINDDDAEYIESEVCRLEKEVFEVLQKSAKLFKVEDEDVRRFGLWLNDRLVQGRVDGAKATWIRYNF